MDKVIEKWDEILQILKVEYDVANVAFNTWLKPLKVYDVKDNVVTILVPSEQSVLLDIVNKKYRLPSGRLPTRSRCGTASTSSLLRKNGILIR